MQVEIKQYTTVATNAVTDTVTNTKTNNKTTSQVSATGVRDTVYDANNKTVASSTVTTSGISNNTNISGIAIKDDKYNTKTMNTSIAQNANGVSILPLNIMFITMVLIQFKQQMVQVLSV